MQGWLKIPAAADYMGISPRSLRSLLKKGGLKYSQLDSGMKLLAIKNIDKYLEQFEVGNNETIMLGNTMETEVDRLVREIQSGQ